MVYTEKELIKDCSLIKRQTNLPKKERAKVLEKVWYAFTKWLADMLENGKGCKIGKIGQLTFEKRYGRKGDVIKSNLVLDLADGYAKSHNLRNRKDLVPRLLNPSAEVEHTKIAIRYSRDLTKDQVFHGLRNMIQRISTAASTTDNMSINFGTVGTLNVRDRLMSFSFDPLFTSLVESREVMRLTFEEEKRNSNQEEAKKQEQRLSETQEQQPQVDEEDDELLKKVPSLYISGEEFDEKYAVPKHTSNSLTRDGVRSCSSPFLFASETRDKRMIDALLSSLHQKEAVFDDAFGRHQSEMESLVEEEIAAAKYEHKKKKKEIESQKRLRAMLAKRQRSLQEFLYNQIEEKRKQRNVEKEESKKGVAMFPFIKSGHSSPDDRLEDSSGSLARDKQQLKKILRSQINERRRRLRQEKKREIELERRFLNNVSEEYERSKKKQVEIEQQVKLHLRGAWERDCSFREKLKTRLLNATKATTPTKDESVGFDMRSFKNKPDTEN